MHGNIAIEDIKRRYLRLRCHLEHKKRMSIKDDESRRKYIQYFLESERIGRKYKLQDQAQELKTKLLKLEKGSEERSMMLEEYKKLVRS